MEVVVELVDGVILGVMYAILGISISVFVVVVLVAEFSKVVIS